MTWKAGGGSAATPGTAVVDPDKLRFEPLAKQHDRAGFSCGVDANDETAARFYGNYDFQRFPERPDRLFLPMTAIAKLFP